MNNPMIEKAEHLDQQLFLFLNSINSPFWDQVMHTLTARLIWVPLYFTILIYLAIKYKSKFFIIFIFIILAAAMADQLSVLIKNLVQRPRPCHEPSLDGLVHQFNTECGGMYSFVSSHATNSFDVAMISLLFIKRLWYTIFIIFWAFIVSYTRIYLGVHYPADMFFGALTGMMVGWSVYQLYVLTDQKILQKKVYFKRSELP